MASIRNHGITQRCSIKIITAAAILVGFHKAPIIIAYKISTAVPDYYQRALACRKCLQRFAPHGNFTFDFCYKTISDLKRIQKYDKVEMFADITNDIPFALVSASCSHHNVCSRIHNRDESTLIRERKILNILTRTEGSAYDLQHTTITAPISSIDLPKIRSDANMIKASEKTRPYRLDPKKRGKQVLAKATMPCMKLSLMTAVSKTMEQTVKVHKGRRKCDFLGWIFTKEKKKTAIQGMIHRMEPIFLARSRLGGPPM